MMSFSKNVWKLKDVNKNPTVKFKMLKKLERVNL